MIRTKAKSILLSIMLLMACFMFFACKEDSEIKVESIAFTEQSISLLVGEEYTPTIKVLPSYATSRSYTLISNDTTALKVDGGTITALKAMKGIKLKVVSDENENINDVISVDVYSEAVQLEVPTGLKFDGSEFTFVGRDNVEGYVLKINGQEISIGNNTEYAFSNIIDKIDGLYNEVVRCSVKSVGDGKIFKDSEYSQEISFVNLSGVNNAYVENNTLYFDGIKNVASYTVDIIVDNEVKQQKVVNNENFEERQLSLPLTDLVDSVNGVEYSLKITNNIDGYNAEEVLIFANSYTKLNYTIIGTVKNLAINDKVVSWDFVENAQSYTVKMYKDGDLLQTYENITCNYLQIAYDNAGEYYCEILANSNALNTTTGKIYSEPLSFKILSIPEIIIEDNNISWSDILEAEGYFVTIKNVNGATVVNKSFVFENSYYANDFAAGTYNIEVTACGNGENIISSQVSNKSSFTILNSVQQLKIEDKKLYWKDADGSTLNKYRLIFDNIDTILTENNYNSQYNYDANSGMFSYDLSGHQFNAGTYQISLQSLGGNNVFNSVLNIIPLTKLAEGSITSLENKQFKVNQVPSASSYKIEIYKTSDLNTAIMTLDQMSNGYKFDLNASVLDAGNYVAKVFVYGNRLNVFDADNGNDGTTITFEKLAIPTITIDSTDIDNLKIIVDSEDLIKSENSYKLYQNNSSVSLVDSSYSLMGLSAGDYIYKAQAIGNRGTVLDSETTIVENQRKVKKLSTPTMTFDKNTLSYTVACVDDEFVGEYVFTLNETKVPVSKLNKVANCQDLIIDAQTYKANLYAEPEVASAGYNLVIKSETQIGLVGGYNEVIKLNGLCNFQISSGNLIVTPNKTLSGSGYNLQLRIENGANDILLDNFTYTGARFEKRLYDSAKYNIIDEMAVLLQGAGEYEVFTTISQNRANVVTSDEVKVVEPESVNTENPVARTLKVLGKVDSVDKNNQAIEFSSVNNATNYIAVIELNNVEYYIDIADKYTTDTNNVLQMQDLLQLMQTKGVSYREETPYTISFVAVNNDICTIPTKGTNTYIFKFLQSPTISIVEQEGANTKYLNIINDINASKYDIVIRQESDINYEIKHEGNNTTINMDQLTSLVAGDVKIIVGALTTHAEYFNSKTSEINIEKLDSPEITIENGLLKWRVVNNVKQYNLTYNNNISSGTIALKQGVDNFTIEGSTCVYNFDSLESNLTSMYLQVDSNVKSGNVYYLNSNNGPIIEDVYKLETVTIKVVNGKLYTEISNKDLLLQPEIQVIINNKVVPLNIIKADQEDIELTHSADKLGITIDPKILFAYGENELLLENISIKLYSSNNTTLNSSVASKDVYGLLNPTGLDITTSKVANDAGVVDEVLEKITWNNPTANATYVVNYEITITYNGKDYKFNSAERAFMMPTFDDADSDGILDEEETEFGAGDYKIKVRALTDNCDNVVNSRYSDEINITVLATPQNLLVKDGNVVWSSDMSVGYYLLKVYLLNGDNRKLLASTEANTNTFDLCTLTPFNTGVYGVSIQALHNNSKILASKESDILQVIRLPQVEKYYVKNGEFGINVHKFYTKAEVYFTDKATGTIVHTFPIENKNLTDYNSYVGGEFKGWLSSDIINTYKDKTYFVDAKYEIENDSTLRAALSQDYRVSVKLFGNTAIDGAIISGHVCHDVINTYWQDNEAVTDKNIVEKLVTPTIEISKDERGVVLLDIPRGLDYSLNYNINGEKSLQGVHIYQINIYTNATYTLYVAEIVDNALFKASLDSVGSQLIANNEHRNDLKYFEYNGITFNVIEKNEKGYIPFNFNVNKYYYYTSDGVYSDIDLTIGGSFVVSARFVGDDSCFVQSDLSDIETIDRYHILNLTINNGVVSWINKATADDHPMYLINLSNDEENYNVVLYNPNVQYEEGKKYTEEYLLKSLDSGKTYIFDTITYSLNNENPDNVIIYKALADIIDKARLQSADPNIKKLVGTGGTFSATIKTHYTDSTSMDKILAQAGDISTVVVLPKADIKVVDGTLTWNMSYITSSGGREPINSYLLQVFNENNKLYEITLNSGDYDIESKVDENNETIYVATYQLPKVLNNEVDGEFKFEQNLGYTFKLISLTESEKNYINSVATETDLVEILPDLQNVRMEDGKLKWTNSTTNTVEVYVSYQIGSVTVTFNDKVVGDTYELPASFKDNTDTERQLIAGYSYYIKVRLLGDETSLNGFFSEQVKTNEVYPQRLATINNTTINTAIVDNNSLLTLTWQANDKFEGVKYTVVYTLENGETYTSAMLDTNSFDFNGVASGKIKVKVFAHHNSHFTSFGSDTDERGNSVPEKIVEVFKLSIPINITYNTGTTTISWDKVLDKDGSEINNYMVSIQQEGLETQEYKCTTNEWGIMGVISNSFKISVKAISVEENGFTINSDYSEPQSMALPNQVDVTTFVFDKELQAFKWKAIEGEQETDTYYIGYNYYDKILSADDNIQPTKTESKQVTQTQIVDGVKYYYFYPNMIGSYRLIYVQVERAGSLSSQPTLCKDQNGANYDLDFDLFTSGEGTSTNPYVISNERHLRNIKYFLGASYEIDKNITLTSNEPITNNSQIFTGTINGNGCYINGVNVTEYTLFNDSGYVGLFSRVKGATFINIALSNFTLKGYVNSATLYMGVLVGYAENLIVDGNTRISTFKDIIITSSKIELVKNNSIGYMANEVNMYVGLIAGYALDCKFESCNISSLGQSKITENIIIEITGSQYTNLVLGGISGYANNSEFKSNSTKDDYMFIIKSSLMSSSSMPTIYVGSLVGEAGNNVTTSDNSSCVYGEITSQGLAKSTNEIGK